VELRIDPEFERLIPPLTTEELTQLTTNLTTEGCRDPLSVWPTTDGPPILLDGHNRYRICAANNLPFDVVAVSLDSREDAIRWIINNQFGRRNLTEEQKSYLRGQRYNLEKKSHGGNRRLEESSGENHHLKTEERLAEEYKVAPKTIREDGQFAKGLDALKEIREDLPKSVLTRRNHQVTKGKRKAQVTKARSRAMVTPGDIPGRGRGRSWRLGALARGTWRQGNCTGHGLSP
jgi:hypothetical protein